MKKLVALLLILCLGTVLAACGGTKNSEFVGEWVATRYDVWGEESGVAQLGEGWLKLEADGTGSMAHMGDITSVRWTPSGKTFKLTDEKDLSYTVEYDGKSLSIGVLGMIMYLERGDIESARAEAQSADKLSGDWYGWWIVTEATGEYAQSNNDWWDICAAIKFDKNGNGEIALWDEDFSRDKLLGSVEIRRLTGTAASSVSGYFAKDKVADGEWSFDTEADTDIPNSIFIVGTYEGAEGSYTYSVVIRPWGQRWDDTDEKDRPFAYETWYLPLIDSKAKMPDSIG